ncbi:hypothetical protein JCM14036_25470 [Desulfotomaculum defluvii]
MVISFFLKVENLLYNYFMTFLRKALGSEVFSVIQQINLSITLGCSLIVALLLVYALYNYRTKTQFLCFIKPSWLAVLILVWFGSSIVALVQSNTFNEFIYLLPQITVGIIYFYGFRTSINMYKLHNDNLFRWFTWIFICYLTPVLLSIITIAFTPFPDIFETRFFALYNYVAMVFAFGKPTLLLLFLLKYHNEEPVL